jgi:hypothetical protein
MRRQQAVVPAKLSAPEIVGAEANFIVSSANAFGLG